jgi:isoleucyl-tRNA synthetase
MYHIVEAMSRWLAPILSFTADEVWRHIPGERAESVFLAAWYDGLFALDAEPSPPPAPLSRGERREGGGGVPPESDQAPAFGFDRAFWDTVLAVRINVAKQLESARKDGAIGSSLDAELDLYCDQDLVDTLTRLGDELRFALITSDARVHPLVEKPADAQETELTGLEVRVTPSPHPKCVRCWHHRQDVGVSPDHPELCGRCVENVAGAGERRDYA